MNYSTLSPSPLSFSTPLKNNSDVQEWDGQRSRRFSKGKRFEPHNDLIKTSTFAIIEILTFQIRLQLQEEFISTNHLALKNHFDLQFIRLLLLSIGACGKAKSGQWISDP